MKDKLIMLFNFESHHEKRKAKEFAKLLPENSAKILDYGIVGRPETREVNDSLISLWVNEHLYLSAWTYFNHKDLKNSIVTFQDGLDYLQLQKNKEKLVKDINEFQ